MATPSGMEVDRDRVDENQRPETEGQRHRQPFDHQVHYRSILVVTLAEFEGQVVLDHLEIAFMDRPVEAVQLLYLGDQLRVQSLGAGVLGRRLEIVELRLRVDSACDAGRGVDVLPGEIRDHLVDGTAGSELHDEEVDRDDPDQRREDQQQPPCNVTKHARPPRRFRESARQRRMLEDRHRSSGCARLSACPTRRIRGGNVFKDVGRDSVRST